MTLGYGKRSIGETVDLLQQHSVRYLIDIRSAPYSKYRPDFSHDALKAHMQAHGIGYLFMGNELGGRPDDPACYDEDGRVDYDACRVRAAFLAGIGRLRTAWEGGHRVALLCSESRPEECHRSKLVGAALGDGGIPVLHLDEDGAPLSQEEVMARLDGGQLGLFDTIGHPKASKSRGRYRTGSE